ncbi:UTP--glucose-1-phosphate uridylyltransferase GalU [Pullulanibacillus sp. KACC 23026]|uniref:UTP--glucose-1-phosphate uridylyltransferase GalU n=1 Tax=Pullulanibacillus sp. KACC 23026 TaxID=3028315 RepID=UPI0023AE747B|nr:UTP--glucose-1-phosphate uridylyltransferase GalU [Pullulanibacillus sp. KACC 23026]WEG13145.1 UTP--glucose-1-phosphate uridylyltransferase GalU [Pullulanibacillus sp. KACC 23026]
MKIRKAIIPAAGLGTRLLPATKAQPKEMLPIVDKPAIQYIVEEAVSAGIEDIIIVTGRNKRAIEDHFDKSFELETILESKGKQQYLDEVRSISKLGNIHYIRQGEALGLGHAIQCAKGFIGNEPFAVLLGDDIVRSNVPAIGQLMDIYENYEASVVGVKEVEEKDVEKYGVVAIKNREGSLIEVDSLVEKPPVALAPSKFAIMGRYVLSPEIFDILESQEPGAGGEIQLTDAINKLAQKQNVYAYNFEGRRFDTGDKISLIKATIEIALEREDLKEELSAYLNQLTNQFQLK